MAKQQAPELEQERDGIGEAVQETGQASDPIADAAQARQPEKPKTEDLTSNEQFRKWQAEYDRKLAALQKERENERAYWQRQAEEAQQRVRERELAEMDDYQRAQYERDEALRIANDNARRYAELQTQIARERELNAIAAKFGVPREALEEATSRAEALEMAWDYKQQTEQEQRQRQERDSEERRQQREEKRAANKVDTGAGIGSTPKSDFERDYEAALKSGDSKRLAKFLFPQG